MNKAFLLFPNPIQEFPQRFSSMDVYHITLYYNNIFKRTTLTDQQEEIDYADNCALTQ